MVTLPEGGQELSDIHFWHDDRSWDRHCLRGSAWVDLAMVQVQVSSGHKMKIPVHWEEFYSLAATCTPHYIQMDRTRCLWWNYQPNPMCQDVNELTDTFDNVLLCLFVFKISDIAIGNQGNQEENSSMEFVGISRDVSTCVCLNDFWLFWENSFRNQISSFSNKKIQTFFLVGISAAVKMQNTAKRSQNP